MRFIQSTSFIVFLALSSNAYGMIPDDEASEIQALHSLRPAEITAVIDPEAIVENFLRKDAPESISVDGCIYTSEEYFSLVGADNAHRALGHKYKLEAEKAKRELEKQIKKYEQEGDALFSDNDLQKIESLVDRSNELLTLFFVDSELRSNIAQAWTIYDKEAPKLIPELFARGILYKFYHGLDIPLANLYEYMRCWTYIGFGNGPSFSPLVKYFHQLAERNAPEKSQIGRVNLTIQDKRKNEFFTQSNLITLFIRLIVILKTYLAKPLIFAFKA